MNASRSPRDPRRRRRGAAGRAKPTDATSPPELRLVERHENSLMSLFELSHELGVALDPYGIAQLTLFSLMGRFGTVRSALWLLPEGGGGAVLMRAFGIRDDAARAIGAGLAARAITRTTDLAAPVALADWEHAAAPETRHAITEGMALIVPLSARKRATGLIGLGTRLTGEPYAAMDLDYLAAAAGMVGVALENTRLYHGMLEANRRLRETNEGLAEIDRLKSEFLQNVNHELRTPLAIIIGYLNILKDTPTIEGAPKQAVTVSLEQAEKLTDMVQDLLEFSASSDDLATLDLRSYDVPSLLRAYAEVRRPGVVQGLREFVLEVEDELPRAECDAKRLQRILDVLVDNAVKFTPPGSRICLRARRGVNGNGNGVAVEVEDNGPGIPKRHLETLFEPFRQGDGSSTRTAGGLGLGLALVRQIADRMGAGLEVASEFGTGSTFTVNLRVA
jgi:signal transduction histidine kinase